ncbi:hypothetical protein D3C86_2032230 [compost metagenome]
MVGCPVTLHTGQVTAWRIRVDHAQINSECRHTNLSVHLPPAAGERHRDRFLEGTIKAADAAGNCFSQRSGPSLCKLEEVLQVTYTNRLGAREIYLFRLQASEDT